MSATLDGTGSCLIRVTPEEDEVNDTLKDVLAHIDAGAAAVRAEGDKLTARIKLFEEWLSRLAGRVEANCEICSTHDGHADEYLALTREGKEWRLVVYWYNHQVEEVHDRSLLRDAAMDRKIRAVQSFPALLKAIADRHKSLADQAAAAATGFDALAESLRMKGGE